MVSGSLAASGVSLATQGKVTLDGRGAECWLLGAPPANRALAAGIGEKTHLAQSLGGRGWRGTECFPPAPRTYPLWFIRELVIPLKRGDNSL